MNLRKITIDNPNQTSAIVNIIHDCWFDVDNIRFDPEKSSLTIKFKREVEYKARVIRKNWLFKTKEIPIVEYLLNIYYVKKYEIKDTEQVGLYDFNELHYDPDHKRIKITTGVPIEIDIAVEQFKISVEETDKIIEMKTSVSILD